MECEICHRIRDRLFKHHLKPKAEGGKHSVTIKCCLTCSRQVHMLFSTKELAKMTLEQLVNKPAMVKFIDWIKDKEGEYSMRLSRRLK